MFVLGGLRQLVCWAITLTMAVPIARANEDLVEHGRQLFFTETFNGNGRTCGTCHPADNNYTIDPAYIARLPATDPLFVFEHDRKLAGLERPRLLRKLGLVVVHADGFDRPGVLRAVPHLLGIARSLLVEPGAMTPPTGSRDLAAATGWSGDGAPGRGSLREFALGAVREHLPRSLARIPGVDFRVPTDAELRALEAFMRSLGHHAADEVDIANGTGVTFSSPLVEHGRDVVILEERTRTAQPFPTGQRERQRSRRSRTAQHGRASEPRPAPPTDWLPLLPPVPAPGSGWRSRRRTASRRPTVSLRGLSRSCGSVSQLG